MSVLMSDATRSREFGIEATTQAAEGLGVGAAVGGVTGAVLAAIVAVGTSIAIPGPGLVVAGPLAAALAGAGGLTGGLIGTMVGAGVPEYRARVYESGLRAGGILLGVEAEAGDGADEIEKLFGDLGAQRVTQD